MTLFHTLVHIGCKNADGKSEVADVFTAIWSEFTDRDVKRVDGTQLTYWAGADPPDSTAGLLDEGDGRCGAWMRFLDDCARAQGMTTTQRTVITTENITGPPFRFGIGFRVKAIPGQGNPTPHRDFADHAVLKYGGKYYDPSYGKPSSGSGYSTQLAWEDDALDLLYYGDDPDPDPEYAVSDPKGTQETKFDP
jgi:hypothetical protein